MRKRSFARGFLAGAGIHALTGFAGAYVLSEAFEAYHQATGTPNPLVVGPFLPLTAGWAATQVLRLVVGVLAGCAAAHWGRARSWAPALVLALAYLATAAVSEQILPAAILIPWIILDPVAVLAGALVYMRRLEVHDLSIKPPGKPRRGFPSAEI